MEKTFLEAWLSLQCQVLPEVRCATVRIDNGSVGEGGLQAVWPAAAEVPEALDDLLGLSLRSGNRVSSQIEVKKVAGSDTVAGVEGGHWLLAQPLKLGDTARGAIALELPGRLQPQQQAVANLLDWGNAWLDFASSSRAGGPSAADFAALIHSISGQPRFQAAALAALGWLAHRFDCQRVSLGLSPEAVGGKRFRLSASSDKAFVAERTDLAQRLEQAMAKAQAELDAGRATSDTGVPPTLHQDQQGAVLAGILSVDGRDFAALCFEPPPGHKMGVERQAEIAALLPLLGGLLGLRWQRERSLFERARRAVRQTSNWIRPLLVSTALVTFALWLASDTGYRVGGDAVVEGEVQQALIAPFEGYIARAEARAGERVVAGQVLAELDDKELRLQRRLRQGDRIELQKEYRKALAGMDHAQARILSAQIEQAEAEIDLLDRQLQRIRLIAPFDGIVVSGDLSRSLGKPVERGEVLFEVAPLDSYRVAIEVRDRDIREISVGQHGTLALAAMPSEHLPLEVVNVTHFSSGEGESEHFRVEARVRETPAALSEVLRPGMRGVAKLELGRRMRLWVWSHDLLDWLRLQLWAWLP